MFLIFFADVLAHLSLGTFSVAEYLASWRFGLCFYAVFVGKMLFLNSHGFLFLVFGVLDYFDFLGLCIKIIVDKWIIFWHVVILNFQITVRVYWHQVALDFFMIVCVETNTVIVIVEKKTRLRVQAKKADGLEKWLFFEIEWFIGV